MSRVARARNCAAGCERMAKGRSGMYADCLSDCRRRSMPDYAEVSYIPAPKRHRATMSSGASRQKASYEYILPPMGQRAYEPSLLDLTTGAVRSVGNLLKFGKSKQRVRKTKSTKTKKAAKPKRAVRRTAVKKPKSKRRPVARWP